MELRAGAHARESGGARQPRIYEWIMQPDPQAPGATRPRPRQLGQAVEHQNARHFKGAPTRHV